MRRRSAEAYTQRAPSEAREGPAASTPARARERWSRSVGPGCEERGAGVGVLASVRRSGVPGASSLCVETAWREGDPTAPPDGDTPTPSPRTFRRPEKINWSRCTPTTLASHHRPTKPTNDTTRCLRFVPQSAGVGWLWSGESAENAPVVGVVRRRWLANVVGVHLDCFSFLVTAYLGVGVGVSPSGGAVGSPSRHAVSTQSEETRGTRIAGQRRAPPPRPPAPQPAPPQPAAHLGR